MESAVKEESTMRKVTLRQFDAAGTELDRLSIQPPLTGVLLGEDAVKTSAKGLLHSWIESDSGAVIDADFEFYWMPKGGRIEIAADPVG